MSGYTKLFSSILASSIWSLPDAVRIVWITLLAMADRNGFVEASLGGIAHQARKDKTATRKALAVLMAPDEDSKNPAHEGRRIQPVEQRGFMILNYARYRDGLSDEPEAVGSRERMRRLRDRRRNSGVTLRNTGDGDGVGAASDSGEGVQGEVPADMPEDGWDLETIVEQASHPTVAMPRSQAEAYFYARSARNWTDGTGQPVALTRKALKGDLMTWKRRDLQRQQVETATGGERSERDAKLQRAREAVKL